MKHFILLPLCIVFFAVTHAQTANVTWGDEFKLKKGSTDLEVIYADNTGIYVKESHMALKSYFLVGATTRESATLIKLDKALAEVYHQDFNKELKGKEYEKFFFFKGKLFILATDYNKKEKMLSLYGAEVNKNDGELAGEFQPITSWQKDEKGDDINFNVSYNSDSTKMVIVSSVEGKEKNNYEVRQFDEKFKPMGKAVQLTNEFDPKTFQLEDVIYTNTGNVIMVARIYQYEEGKKKKSKFLQFVNYNIRIYNEKGEQVKDISTDISAKWLVSTKVVQVPDKELVLAAFYSNEKKGREINGMLIQRIDPASGTVISTSVKDINTSQITTLEDEGDDDSDDDESKKERKERKKLEKIQDDGEGFSRYMRFRNFIFAADNSLIILAEKYNHYTYTTTSTSYSSGSFGGMSMQTSTYDVHDCGDLMMSRMDASGDISWLHVLPKQQHEVIMVGSNRTSGGMWFTMGNNYFASGFNRPFYAGFGVLVSGNNVNILFNDSHKNENVLQLGQKVKRTGYFAKSRCYAIKLDAITGKYTRSELFANNDVPTAMPRLGTSLGRDLYIVGKEDRVFGKTKIAIAKVSVKN